MALTVLYVIVGRAFRLPRFSDLVGGVVGMAGGLSSHRPGGQVPVAVEAVLEGAVRPLGLGQPIHHVIGVAGLPGRLGEGLHQFGLITGLVVIVAPEAGEGRPVGLSIERTERRLIAKEIIVGKTHCYLTGTCMSP